MKVRPLRGLVCCVVAAGCMIGGIAPANASDAGSSETALIEFRANLTAAADLAAFDALTETQRTELARYLLGETDPLAELSDDKPRAGDFEVLSNTSAAVTTTPKSDAGVTSAAATRTVSAWQSFTFAGITISKTTVRETYFSSGASAKSIASYSCVVNANYDPFSTVSASKDGAWVSSSRATAECRVTVKRGAPTPWGQITWSTVSNIQYVTGNGNGSITSHGWR